MLIQRERVFNACVYRKCKSWRFWWCQEELRIFLRKGENVNHASFDGVEKKSHVCHHQKGGECWFVISSPICFDDFYNWLENIVHFYSMWKLLLRFQKLLFTVLPLINILDKSNF